MDLPVGILQLCDKHDINKNMVMFIFETLDNLKGKEINGKQQHVNGKTLCLEIKKLAIEQFGGLARTVLSHFGFNSTNDIGKTIFKLIDIKIMNKDDNDKIEDFTDVYDFEKAFNMQEYAQTIII